MEEKQYLIVYFVYLLGEDEVAHGRPVGEDAGPLAVQVALDLAQVPGREEQPQHLLEHLDQQGAAVPPHRLDTLEILRCSCRCVCVLIGTSVAKPAQIITLVGE